jgi:hypothetical protein
MRIYNLSNQFLGLAVADDVVLVEAKHIEPKVFDKYFPFGLSDVDYLLNPPAPQSFPRQSKHIK